MKFKGITIRSLALKDLKQIKKFQDFESSLIEENVQIGRNRKKTKKQGIEKLKENLKKIKNKKTVFLVAEHDNKIIGDACVNLEKGKQAHVGILGVTVDKDYRGVGLGKFLTLEIIKLAKKKLKPKIIRLSVYTSNKIAIHLYEKYGFKKVAAVPKQFKHKGKFVDEVIMLLYL